VVAPVAVHCSSICVGALHTGVAGLTVKALMLIALGAVVAGTVAVVVVGAGLDEVVETDAEPVVVEAGTVEVTVVEVAGTPPLCPLLQPATATATAAGTSARRRTEPRRLTSGD
jgi:hypothetical protein